MVCVTCCQSSSLYQPPCAFCRRCGSFNNHILVPPNYEFGEVSTMGLETTAHATNPWHHCNDRAKLRACNYMQNCPPMLVLSAKRQLLGFDPENAHDRMVQAGKTPTAFEQPTYYEEANLPGTMIRELLVQVYHCGYTQFPLSLRVPHLPTVTPCKRLHDYTSTRPRRR